jgi:hypothetical protein
MWCAADVAGRRRLVQKARVNCYIRGSTEAVYDEGRVVIGNKVVNSYVREMALVWWVLYMRG